MHANKKNRRSARVTPWYVPRGLRGRGDTRQAGHGRVAGFAAVAVYAALYELTPLRLDPGDWWVWPLLFFADDLAYYWFHRVSHESRLFWASHVVHHSSQHYNLSTALRQTWVPMTYFPFWLPLPLLGFPVWMVLLAQAWSLIYQFWIHTERIHRLPKWVEGIWNTPSHHRVHHGSNHQYLDKNYGGILIVWDRLFGTFAPEAWSSRMKCEPSCRRTRATSMRPSVRPFSPRIRPRSSLTPPSGWSSSGWVRCARNSRTRSAGVVSSRELIGVSRIASTAS